MNSNKYEISTQEKLKKANFLISAMYRATPLEIKCTFLAMYSIQTGDYQEKGDGIYARLSASVIRKHIGETSQTSLYKKLARMAQEMTSRTIGVIDEQEESFLFLTLFNRVSYENGILEIRFPLELKEYLLNQKENFTLIPMKTVMSFKKAYSIKLYEILRKICFYHKYHEGERNYIFRLTKSVDELKFDMGVINANDEKIKHIMLSSGHPDYSLAVKRASEKMYSSWREFKREIIEPAVKELNGNAYSNIRVKYNPIRSGRGGKTTAVEFMVMALEDEKGNSLKRTRQEIDEFLGNEVDITTVVSTASEEVVSKPDKILDEEQKLLVTAEMTAYIKSELAECQLEVKDIMSIIKAAEYDMELIKKSVETAKATKGISNIVGWLISCIKNGGYEQKKNMGTASHTVKNKFNDFPQRKYSKEEMNELEKKLLERNMRTTEKVSK